MDTNSSEAMSLTVTYDIFGNCEEKPKKKGFEPGDTGATL